MKRIGSMVLLALPCCACSASAAPSTPPALFVQAAADKDCGSPRWTALATPKGSAFEEAWLVECVDSLAGHDGKLHRLFAFRRGVDKRETMEKVAELEDSQVPRSRLVHETRVSGSRVTVIARGDYGYLHERTWDLSKAPAQLVVEREGGARPCKRQEEEHPGMHYANAEMAEPICTTDWESRRQTCLRDHPDCKRDPTRFKQLSYTAIPLHSLLGKARTSDPLACATTIGLEKDDLVAGRNPRKTSFQVVAVQDPQAETMRLLVKLDDRTPHFARSAEDDWKGKDHFELWLGSDRDDVTCGAQTALVQFCTALALRWKLTQQVIAPLEGHRDFLVFPSQMKPGPARSPALQVHWLDGSANTIAIELSGPAYQAAYHGALTLAYVDSLDGKRADTVIGTSPLQSGVAETPGRIGDTALCDLPERKHDDTGRLVTLQ